MATVKFKLDLVNPPRFTDEELQRQNSMTDAEITAAAESDPDNPPLTDAELELVASVQAVRRARAATGLSQDQFAEQFRVKPGRLRDLEQGRTRGDSALLAYLSMVEVEPATVKRLLSLAKITPAQRAKAARRKEGLVKLGLAPDRSVKAARKTPSRRSTAREA